MRHIISWDDKIEKAGIAKLTGTWSARITYIHYFPDRTWYDRQNLKRQNVRTALGYLHPILKVRKGCYNI